MSDGRVAGVLTLYSSDLDLNCNLVPYFENPKKLYGQRKKLFFTVPKSEKVNFMVNYFYVSFSKINIILRDA